jgi:hypothetical protein
MNVDFMKTQNLQKPLLTLAAFTLLTFTAAAQDSSNAGSATAQTATTVQAAPPLSYGVPQILEMSQAKVSDGTIITYIQNGGTIYALNAEQIVYLKQQGVSDAVLNAMLNQRSQLAQSATTQSASQQNDSDNANAQTANTVAQPTVTYVQSVPSTSVYVVPDTQTYYYPYYYPYYNYYWYPPVSISFGFGHYWGGGWHGGYHGGGFHGGWHGGGGWHH